MKYLMILTILIFGNFTSFLEAETMAGNSYVLPQNTEAYTRQLKSIAYESNLTETLAQIELTDGTTWNYIVKSSQDYLLADLETMFTIDSTIYIDRVVSTPLYLLFNTPFKTLSNEFIIGKDIIPVGMTKDTKLMLPVILKTEEILVSAGWFWNDYLYRVYLSDGSIWDVIPNNFYVGNFKQLWKEGCRIIPSRNSEKNWCLINTDAPYKYEHWRIDPSTYFADAQADLRFMGWISGSVSLLQEPNQ